MNKAGGIAAVIAGVLFLYLFLLVIIPYIVAPLALTANTTMDASSNMSLYPGTSGMLMSASWILFFVPGVIGIVLVVVIMRQP